MESPINVADLKKIKPVWFGVAALGGVGIFLYMRSKGGSTTGATATGTLADAQYGQELLTLESRLSMLENPKPAPAPAPGPGPVPIPLPIPIIPGPVPKPIPGPGVIPGGTPGPVGGPPPAPFVHHDQWGNIVDALGYYLGVIHHDQHGNPVDPQGHPVKLAPAAPSTAAQLGGLAPAAPNTSQGGVTRPLWPGETVQSVGRQHGLAPQTALAANSAGASPRYPAGNVFIPYGR